MPFIGVVSPIQGNENIIDFLCVLRASNDRREWAVNMFLALCLIIITAYAEDRASLPPQRFAHEIPIPVLLTSMGRNNCANKKRQSQKTLPFTTSRSCPFSLREPFHRPLRSRRRERKGVLSFLPIPETTRIGRIACPALEQSTQCRATMHKQLSLRPSRLERPKGVGGECISVLRRTAAYLRTLLFYVMVSACPGGRMKPRPTKSRTMEQTVGSILLASTPSTEAISPARSLRGLLPSHCISSFST
jgi:hypothetical protein